MLEENINFEYINSNGDIEHYTILDKFEKNKKKFIIYQKEDESEIYAALYEIIDDKIKIIPIENNEDFDIVDEYLESL